MTPSCSVDSRSDTYPTMEVGNASADLEHEASVSKIAATNSSTS